MIFKYGNNEYPYNSKLLLMDNISVFKKNINLEDNQIFVKYYDTTNNIIIKNFLHFNDKISNFKHKNIAIKFESLNYNLLFSNLKYSKLKEYNKKDNKNNRIYIIFHLQSLNDLTKIKFYKLKDLKYRYIIDNKSYVLIIINNLYKLKYPYNLYYEIIYNIYIKYFDNFTCNDYIFEYTGMNNIIKTNINITLLELFGIINISNIIKLKLLICDFIKHKISQLDFLNIIKEELSEQNLTCKLSKTGNNDDKLSHLIENIIDLNNFTSTTKDKKLLFSEKNLLKFESFSDVLDQSELKIYLTNDNKGGNSFNYSTVVNNKEVCNLYNNYLTDLKSKYLCLISDLKISKIDINLIIDYFARNEKHISNSLWTFKVLKMPIMLVQSINYALSIKRTYNLSFTTLTYYLLHANTISYNTYLIVKLLFEENDLNIFGVLELYNYDNDLNELLQNISLIEQQYYQRIIFVKNKSNDIINLLMINLIKSRKIYNKLVKIVNKFRIFLDKDIYKDLITLINNHDTHVYQLYEEFKATGSKEIFLENLITYAKRNKYFIRILTTEQKDSFKTHCLSILKTANNLSIDIKEFLTFKIEHNFEPVIKAVFELYSVFQNEKEFYDNINIIYSIQQEGYLFEKVKLIVNQKLGNTVQLHVFNNYFNKSNSTLMNIIQIFNITNDVEDFINTLYIYLSL